VKLDLRISSDDVILIVTNDGSDPLRIWEFSNSWGWDTISLLLRTPDSEKRYVLEPCTTTIWTVDFPGFEEIPASETAEIALDPGGKSWDPCPQAEALAEQPLLVKAVLEIPQSPEAEEFRIFVGRVESEWVPADPPHHWLVREAEPPAPPG
jgi:hypothetical protein